MAVQFANVDDYVGSFPEDVQGVLAEIRRTIHHAVPGASESISYKIPTVTLNGRSFVYFAAWKSHVSLYPVPAGDVKFQDEIAPYRASRGTVHFPLGKPIPYDLIGRMAAHLARETSAGKG